MKRNWQGSCVTLVLVLSLAPALRAETWNLDPAHSSAQFSVRHMMVSNVRGEFGKVSGRAEYDPKSPAAAQIEATIDATSVNTREPKRDAHLKSADFLDVANFPAITFKSKKVTPEGSGTLNVLGDLTIRGNTREVVLRVEGPAMQPGAGTRMGASATTKINRKDFGVSYNRLIEAGGVVVGDEVTITIDVELVKPRPQAGP